MTQIILRCAEEPNVYKMMLLRVANNGDNSNPAGCARGKLFLLQ